MGTIATPPRHQEIVYQERVDMSFAFGAQSASANVKLFTVDKDTDIDAVEIIDPTGLATSDTNYFVVSIKGGSTVYASFSTKTTGGQGALPANTPTNMVNAAVARIPAGSVVSLDFVLTGTQTIPAGLIHFRGHAR